MDIRFFGDIIDIDDKGKVAEAIWIMHPGEKIDEECSCHCIYKLLTAKQLFEFFKGYMVTINKQQFNKYCNLL